jgi:hypothetical protein
MHGPKHHHHQPTSVDGEHVRPEKTPYWKRAHRDWRLWVGLFFMFAAIAMYVMTVDLSLVPGGWRPQAVSNAGGK